MAEVKRLFDLKSTISGEKYQNMCKNFCANNSDSNDVIVYFYQYYKGKDGGFNNIS